MKYSNDEMLTEIKKRSHRITVMRNYRAIRLLSGLAGGLFITLVAMIIYIPKGTAMASGNSMYGSLLLGMENGGYVLVAFVAFVIGAIVTLLCLRYRKMRDCTEDDKKNEANETKVKTMKEKK